MKNEIKYAIYMLGLGATLLAYAHANFATKSVVEANTDRIIEMDKRIYDIWVIITQKK